MKQFIRNWKKDIIIFFVGTFIFSSFITGFMCGITTDFDVHYYPYQGTIISIECGHCLTEIKHNKCEQIITIKIDYINVNDVIGIYETKSFLNCEPIPNISSSICCSDLINDQIYVQIDSTNSSIITDVSYVQVYNDHIRLIGAIVFISASVLTMVILCIVCHKEDECYSCFHRIKTLSVSRTEYKVIN